MSENFDPVMPDDEGIGMLDILQTLAENARLLIYGPIITALVFLGLSFFFKPSYIATTSIMTPQQLGGAAAALARLGSLAGMAGAATGLKDSADVYIGLLQSRTLMDRMIDRFNMMSIPGVEYREDAQKILKRITRITAGKDGQISISVISRVPKLSADAANAYVEELSKMTAHLAVTEAQQRRAFYERELVKAKDNLTQAEIALSKTGISESVLKFNPAAIGEGLATIKAKIAAKEVQLSAMRSYSTANNPDYHQVQQELAALQTQLTRYDRERPEKGSADYIAKYRDFKYYETLFDQIARQYELAKMDESSEGAIIQLVDVAVPPKKNANMDKALVMLIAWFTCEIVLVIYVFARRALIKASQVPESAAKLADICTGFMHILKPWHRG